MGIFSLTRTFERRGFKDGKVTFVAPDNKASAIDGEINLASWAGKADRATVVVTVELRAEAA